MRLRTAVALGAAAGWIGWAWLPHLATPWLARRGPGDRNRLALTFDDGPDPDWTPRVLDLLRERRVRATFFLVGERAARAPDLVRRIAGEGHEVANHSWSHRSLWLCGPRATEAEVGRAHEYLAGLTGTEPRHFRPPWGMLNASLFPVLRRWRERCILWSVQPEGLRPVDTDVLLGHVLTHAHAGAIVDLHDAEGTPGAPERLCAALPQMLERLTETGYELVTVGELLQPA
jgi:peptidoglycan/xylan/chitin deacetylase (PgdA/CDA1 family)